MSRKRPSCLPGGWPALAKRLVLPVVFAWAPITASCQAATPPTGKPLGEKPHYTADGFQNLEPSEFHGLPDVMKWRWNRFWDGIPERDHPGPALPVAENNPAELKSNRTEPTLTWVGHATLLLQVGGVNVLTDPHFTERASPVSWAGPKRLVRPGLALDQLPPIDAVVISHNHYDHLDLETLRALAARPEKPRIFVPLKLKAFLEAEDIQNVVELDWWDGVDYRGVRIVAVPAQHFSRRGPFDYNKTLWAGWAILHPKFRFYFAGDTGYGKFFKEIKRKLGPFDLAALPIGAYEPRWFMREMHINPAEAVQAFQDLGSRYAVAMHWGTFDLTDELPTTPPKVLARELAGQNIPPEKFFVLRHGETRPLDSILVAGPLRPPEPSSNSRGSRRAVTEAKACVGTCPPTPPAYAILQDGLCH